MGIDDALSRADDQRRTAQAADDHRRRSREIAEQTLDDVKRDFLRRVTVPPAPVGYWRYHDGLFSRSSYRWKSLGLEGFGIFRGIALLTDGRLIRGNTVVARRAERDPRHARFVGPDLTIAVNFVVPAPGSDSLSGFTSRYDVEEVTVPWSPSATVPWQSPAESTQGEEARADATLSDAFASFLLRGHE